uniref:Putative secreted protein n=1 Tax=Amblyomma americanum TaxID=6943 RepID=A0A0C9RXB0_AMBAM
MRKVVLFTLLFFPGFTKISASSSSSSTTKQPTCAGQWCSRDQSTEEYSCGPGCACYYYESDGDESDGGYVCSAYAAGAANTDYSPGYQSSIDPNVALTSATSIFGDVMNAAALSGKPSFKTPSFIKNIRRVSLPKMPSIKMPKLKIPKFTRPKLRLRIRG